MRRPRSPEVPDIREAGTSYENFLYSFKAGSECRQRKQALARRGWWKGECVTIDVQIVGSGLIKFEFLVQRLGSREAARDAFEALVEDLIALIHPDVHSVRANPGDWGIDAFVGQLTRGGEVYIWQAKYFIDGFGKVQQADVRASYKSALAAADKHGYVVKGWTLCIPTTLDAPNTKWWQGRAWSPWRPG